MAEETEATRLRSILFANEDRSVVLIDGPRSIEEAQLLSSKYGTQNNKLRRLVSTKPSDKPFKTPEPKDGTSGLTESVSDLMTAAAANNALEVLQRVYKGPWSLPRVLSQEHGNDGTQKRKRSVSDDEAWIAREDRKAAEVVMPEASTYLNGTISAERYRFLKEAPVFDLIVLDPPWPNRSARRKKGNYNVADSLGEIHDTLSSIPIATHLATDGLVAVWITNKTRVVDLLSGPRGLFAEWGLEMVGEWMWLKVTTSGKPLVDINSSWRKPWERILIARKRGSERKLPCRWKSIVSVPDLHSRKPNLRGLFEDVFDPDYKGLEIFARNLTAGWWSWGDEVLKFQQPEHWVDS